MKIGISAVPVCLLACLSPSAFAEWGLNIPQGVTKVSHEIYDLHMIIFYICVAIAVAVFGVMLYSIIYHRKSRGAKAHHFHESAVVEIIWTIIPLVILAAMAVPATNALIEMYDSSDAEVNVQITGYQWKWRYTYLDDDLDFFSNLSTPQDQINNEQDKGEHYLLEVDKPLVLPINTKIRFLMTANDVIHSWWVPDLAVKKDTIPGFINEAWTSIDKPGIYRGQCTELCGKGHGYMPIVVNAVTKEEYALWLQEQKSQAASANEVKEMSYDELYALGEKVYNTNCLACHQATGLGMPPVFPALKGSEIATQKERINDHINVVMHGKAGTAMAAYKDQLTVTEIAAVVTYERNAWENNSGDTITPAQVDALKQPDTTGQKEQ